MISIIVPIYKVEAYLPKCIESLINQTYRDVEIILVDDGSPDHCGLICDNYAKEDNRIQVIHQTNRGVSAARNAGLEIAKGDYIGFVDPDDWVAPEFYETMLNNMQKSHADLAISGYAYCHVDGNIDVQRLYQRKTTETLIQKEVMKRMSDIPPSIRHGVWNKLFQRSLLDGILFQEHLKSSEDVWFLTEYLLKIKSAIFIHEPYYINRVREGSATHGGLSVQNLLDSFQAHRFMYQNIIGVYPELKEYSQAFLLDAYLLKYHQAKKKKEEESQEYLKQMRKAIHKEGLRALFNREIYWKTRIAYLLTH